jgi:hypothetical protein
VRYNWSNQSGMKIAFDFQNYVEGARTPPGEKQTIRRTA